MAESPYIEKLKEQVANRELSIEWYRQKIREFGRPTSQQLIREGKRGNRPFIGRLNMFVYDPKLKQKLPYYDTFPLVLPLRFYSDGFLGINFHYLPIPLRMQLLDKLTTRFSSNSKMDETTILRVSYNAVKRVKLIKPTIHKYLKGFVESQFRRIDADEFMIAVALPVQRFRKQSARKVWSDSRKAVL
tara:strand:- start:117 stop:680 length:564 start_codon:yes stop_codon:yes gene_type:complete